MLGFGFGIFDTTIPEESRIKIDIERGNSTILNGGMQLSEDKVEYFTGLDIQDWSLETTMKLSPFELELALDMSQMKKKHTSLGKVEERLSTALEKMASEVVQDMDINGILIEKCRLCRKTTHTVQKGEQETACPKFRETEVCVKCGITAGKGCYGGFSNMECNEKNFCKKEECSSFPQHASKIHEVTGPTINIIRQYYGESFQIKQKKSMATTNMGTQQPKKFKSFPQDNNHNPGNGFGSHMQYNSTNYPLGRGGMHARGFMGGYVGGFGRGGR